MLLELRGIGAGTTEGAPYVLCGWNPAPQRVSLLWEVGDPPVVWLVRVHCTLLWLKVLSSKVYDEKL